MAIEDFFILEVLLLIVMKFISIQNYFQYKRTKTWLNVLINIGGVKDDGFRNEYAENGKALLVKGTELADYIYHQIENSL